MREHMPKNEIQNGAREIGARRAEMLSRGLGDASVLDTGRTGTLTGAAEETKIEVFFETLVELNASVGSGFD
jgi:hypothetical protein